MSCEATPAHASEPFEWRIRQRSRYGSRFSEAEAAENCFIFRAKIIAPKFRRDFVMQGLVNVFGMNKCVEAIPKQSDMKGFYSTIDVLVLPSINEAFGLVVLEAMAFGKPCIVSSTAGIAEIINSQNGFVFNRRKLSDFIQTIIKVIKIYNEEFSRFKDYCKNAFETSGIYTWEKFARKILESSSADREGVNRY